eukprot:TRINITY_DN1033_c0_g1_i15.p5 TRINITY_DN1033_c0_g1~~TRINITY_DN1033_c0_g1_i15.p5  ORF type:complete len:106 (-),score=1.29 TRINITY_DN1033_c0_g1_i15:815-1132(-)
MRNWQYTSIVHFFIKRQAEIYTISKQFSKFHLLLAHRSGPIKKGEKSLQIIPYLTKQLKISATKHQKIFSSSPNQAIEIDKFLFLSTFGYVPKTKKFSLDVKTFI